MSWTKMNQSTRSMFYAATVISLAAIGLWIGVQNNKIEANTTFVSANTAPAATFTGTGTGNIPDLPSGTTCQTAQGAPLNITFNVTGITGSVSNVALSMTATHSWVGDLTTTLIAPNGASHVLFARTGATTSGSSGDSDNLAGTYSFADANTTPPSGGWWQETTAVSTHNMTAGAYRTTAPGGAGATDPAPATNMNAAFSGVANANGTWTLRVTDGCNIDTGSVSAATLTVEGAAAVPSDANVDFNGDGKTDFVVARGTTTPLSEGTSTSEFAPRRNFDSSLETKSRTRRDKSENLIAPPIYWYTSINGSGVTGVGQLGDAATDFLTPEDFDGDGKDDLAVWTPGAAGTANFKILQSSNNTVRVELFGQDGDDPAVVGDYDGDNKADTAVYRCPDSAGADGQCYFFYRGTMNNPSGNVTYVPWGFGVDGDFFPYVGDFDGDGKNDFCIQRANPSSPTNGQFILLKSNGLGIEYINWGLSSDFLIPGDYDGDGKTDLCVRRSNTPSAGQRTYYILTRTGATNQVQWGINGDTSVPGDYDGDGKTDLAIWRGSATPGASRFWILNSSNSSVSQFVWGQCPTTNTCDFAVASWLIH
jgi:subtilisin-like proprotein convertase family protein